MITAQWWPFRRGEGARVYALVQGAVEVADGFVEVEEIRKGRMVHEGIETVRHFVSGVVNGWVLYSQLSSVDRVSEQLVECLWICRSSNGVVVHSYRKEIWC